MTAILERRATRQAARRLTDDDAARYSAIRDRLLAEASTCAAEGDAAMLLAHDSADHGRASQAALHAVGRYAQAQFRHSMATTYQRALDAGRPVS